METVSEIKNRIMPKSKKKFNKYLHKKQPWVTYGILKSLRHKDKLYKKWKTTNPEDPMIQQHKENFKIFFNVYKRVLSNAKKNYFSVTFQKFKSDMKNTWKTIKELLNKKKIYKNLPSKFRFENSTIEGDQKIADKFNEFFCQYWKKIIFES